MYLIGYDIGSSSIKAALVDARTGAVLARAQQPEGEMDISAPQAGWAEQDPDQWWDYVCRATRQLLQFTAVNPADIKGIGIAYQMHGLVLVDEERAVVRPAIIWCDSRAVATGDAAFEAIGPQACLSRCLNSPGNFTASKLAWVMANEPEAYRRSAHLMLPGDYIALRLSGEATTTSTGLSEGVLWDFQSNDAADLVLDHYGIDRSLVPTVMPVFGRQAVVNAEAAAATGLTEGTPITYRAGDQPNNALSLRVLSPGEVAATAGTSGVVYGVVDKLVYDAQSRVNSFAHVNHQADAPRIGVLLCINGTGILHRWLRQQVNPVGTSYQQMEDLAAQLAPGADGLTFLPFGNGAERMLGNRVVGAHLLHLDLNRHTRSHLIRAGLEGIAFSFVYGMEVLRELGLDTSLLRVGNDNLFQSDIFASTVATLVDCRIEVYGTTGAVGAALASGVGAGLFGDATEALGLLRAEQVIEARPAWRAELTTAYERWVEGLEKFL